MDSPTQTCLHLDNLQPCFQRRPPLVTPRLLFDPQSSPSDLPFLSTLISPVVLPHSQPLVPGFLINNSVNQQHCSSAVNILQIRNNNQIYSFRVVLITCCTHYNIDHKTPNNWYLQIIFETCGGLFHLLCLVFPKRIHIYHIHITSQLEFNIFVQLKLEDLAIQKRLFYVGIKCDFNCST